MKTLRFHDLFRGEGPSGKEELAADGVVLSLDYSHELDYFGYSSSDKLAYIRKFSPVGTEMKLVAVLQGHEAEVTQVMQKSGAFLSSST